MAVLKRTEKIHMKYNREFLNMLNYFGWTKKQFEKILLSLKVPFCNENEKVTLIVSSCSTDEGIVWNINCNDVVDCMRIVGNMNSCSVIRLNNSSGYVDYTLYSYNSGVYLHKVSEKHLFDDNSSFLARYGDRRLRIPNFEVEYSNVDKEITIRGSWRCGSSRLKKFFSRLSAKKNLSIFDVLSNLDEVDSIKTIKIVDRVTGKEEVSTFGENQVMINFGESKITLYTVKTDSQTCIMKFNFKYNDFSLLVDVYNANNNVFAGHDYSLPCYGEIYNYLCNLQWPISLEELCKNLLSFLSNFSSCLDMCVSIVNDEKGIKEDITISNNEFTHLYIRTNEEEIAWTKNRDFIYTVKQDNKVVSVSVTPDLQVIYHGPINVEFLSAKVMNPLDLIAVGPVVVAQEKWEQIKSLSINLSRK